MVIRAFGTFDFKTTRDAGSFLPTTSKVFLFQEGVGTLDYSRESVKWWMESNGKRVTLDGNEVDY
jgi:hypothetical protein